MNTNTKLDTAVLIAKASCFLIVGFFTPLGVGLAQWANSGQWPTGIVWVVIGASCVVGGATQLLSFLSGSYSDYVSKKATGFDTSHLTRLHEQEQPRPKI